MVVKCHTCEKKIENGMIYQDKYFFNYHCSWECLVRYMCEFFDVNKQPNITVINGIGYYDE